MIGSANFTNRYKYLLGSEFRAEVEKFNNALVKAKLNEDDEERVAELLDIRTQHIEALLRFNVRAKRFFCSVVGQKIEEQLLQVQRDRISNEKEPKARNKLILLDDGWIVPRPFTAGEAVSATKKHTVYDADWFAPKPFPPPPPVPETLEEKSKRLTDIASGVVRKADEPYTWITDMPDPYPDTFKYYADKASDLLKYGEHEDALKASEAMISKEPKNPLGYRRKGSVLRAMGDFKEACKVFKKASEVSREAEKAIHEEELDRLTRYVSTPRANESNQSNNNSSSSSKNITIAEMRHRHELSGVAVCTVRIGCFGRPATKICNSCGQYNGGIPVAYCDDCFRERHPWHRVEHEWEDIRHRQVNKKAFEHEYASAQIQRELKLLDEFQEQTRQLKQKVIDAKTLVKKQTAEAVVSCNKMERDIRFAIQGLRDGNLLSLEKFIPGADKWFFMGPDTLVEDQREDAAAAKMQGLFRIKRARKHIAELFQRMYAKYFDMETGTYFYRNRETRKSTWVKPGIFGRRDIKPSDDQLALEKQYKVKVATTIQRIVRRRQAWKVLKRLLITHVWRKLKDIRTGHMYFVNTRTGKTSWSLPPGLKEHEIKPGMRFAEDMTPHEASDLIMGAWRRYRARCFVVRLVQTVYTKIYDGVNERFFYYNSKDDTSAWTLPSLLRGRDILPTKYGIDEVEDVDATRRRREVAKKLEEETRAEDEAFVANFVADEKARAAKEQAIKDKAAAEKKAKAEREVARRARLEQAVATAQADYDALGIGKDAEAEETQADDDDVDADMELVRKLGAILSTLEGELQLAIDVGMDGEDPVVVRCSELDESMRLKHKELAEAAKKRAKAKQREELSASLKAAEERSAKARARRAREKEEKARLREVAMELETHVVAARESRDADALEAAIKQAVSDGLTEQSAPVIKARVLAEKLVQEAEERRREAEAKALVRAKEAKKAQGRLDDAVAQAKIEYEGYVAITDDEIQGDISKKSKATGDKLETELAIVRKLMGVESDDPALQPCIDLVQQLRDLQSQSMQRHTAWQEAQAALRAAEEEKKRAALEAEAEAKRQELVATLEEAIRVARDTQFLTALERCIKQVVSGGLGETSAPVVEARAALNTLRREKEERELEENARVEARAKRMAAAKERLDKATETAQGKLDEYKAVTQGDQLAAVAEQAKASADALEAEMQLALQMLEVGRDDEVAQPCLQLVSELTRVSEEVAQRHTAWEAAQKAEAKARQEAEAARAKAEEEAAAKIRELTADLEAAVLSAKLKECTVSALEQRLEAALQGGLAPTAEVVVAAQALSKEMREAEEEAKAEDERKRKDAEALDTKIRRAATKLQSIFRRRHATTRIEALVYRVYHKILDRQSGVFYYYNTVSNTSQWNKPKLLPEGKDLELTPRSRELTLAAAKIQSLYRRRTARAYFRWLIREIFEKGFDERHGRHYYFNKNTGISTWEKPKILHEEEVELELTPRSRAMAIKLNEAATVVQRIYRKRAAKKYLHMLIRATWEKALDPGSQQEYYFNRFTGESQWEKPEAALKLLGEDDLEVVNPQDRVAGGGEAYAAEGYATEGSYTDGSYEGYATEGSYTEGSYEAEGGAYAAEGGAYAAEDGVI